MPVIKKNRPVRQKSLKNTKRCNCDCNYNSESHAAKSPVKTSKSITAHKQKEVRTKKALNNNNSSEKSLSKKDQSSVSKCASKEKRSKLKLARSTSKSEIVTGSSLKPQTNNKQPIVILSDDIKSKDLKITHLASRDDTRKSQSQQSIKQCRVLLTPLPQKVLEQKLIKNTEKTNKSKPMAKMKNMLKPRVTSKKILRGSSTETTTKVDEADTNQPNSLENNTRINSAASLEEIKENPKNYTRNNEDKVIKKPLVDRTNLKPSPVQKLRKRKFFNYAESSLEISRDPQKNVNANKIPIYQQQTENKVKMKKQNDTYEFDSDSEQRKKRKKRKLNNSSSDEYNKTIENILKNVATRINRRKFPNYKNKQTKNTKPMKPSTVPMKNENVIQNKPIINVTSELKNNEVEKHITSEAVKTHRLDELPTENIEIQDYSDGDDNDVDFGFDYAEVNKENSPKIKIISDIRLPSNKELNFSVGTPSKFREVRPNANSTMLNNVLTPWRFNDVHIMRNPHFITLKESSLPCISQDMVLDHTMVDKFADTARSESAKTPLRIPDENHKKMIQSIVTDFLESCTENKENENTQLSLFDNDQFSPIKNRHHGSKVDSVKRRILGELNDNTKKMYASTPKQNTSDLRVPELVVSNQDSANSDVSANLKNKSNREFTNFGFTSSDEENDNQNSPDKDRDNKPFRLNINTNDKKYPVKQKLKKPEKAQSVKLSDSESELSDAESYSGEGKLFEDFADTDDDRFLEPKINKKKKKLKWMDNHNTDTQKHRRRKDIRTKEEEAEAEKWAAAFNSMCQEIEKFPLEIE